MVLFVWPSWFWDDSYYFEKVREYSIKNNIYTFDLKKIFSYYKEEEVSIKYDGHPTALANKLVAKSLYRCLVNNNVLTGMHTEVHEDKVLLEDQPILEHEMQSS